MEIKTVLVLVNIPMFCLFQFVYSCGQPSEGAEAATGVSCVSGQTQPCRCPDGSASNQVCLDETFTYDACQCSSQVAKQGTGGEAGSGSRIPEAGNSGSFDAGENDGAVTGGGTSSATPPDTGGSADAGTEGLSDTGGSGSTPPPVTTPTGGEEPTMLPIPIEPCPIMATGMVTILGVSVNLQVGTQTGTQKGPIVIGWGMAVADNNEVLSQGGVVASILGSTQTGTNTGNGVFFTGDYEIADQIVACSIEQQLDVDLRRIYTGGHSTGGLQAGCMTFFRSGYLAAAVPSSGGITPFCQPLTLQDPNHVPAIMTMHGARGVDVVIVEFIDTSLGLDQVQVANGGFAIDCDHGGGHEGPPADLRAAAWEFLKAHPFGTKPSPYAAGLPASFPSYCTIIE
ncbi:MAG: hypothetical protein JXA30_06140 [Deltaproteobacteria bacterium]|nr:hypothetical protein [Deltaproteobacteria bacterium]